MVHRVGRLKNYGNIEVCERWKSYQNFLADMGEKPKDGILDRIDPFKGYSPKNCRWVDRSLSERNKKPRGAVLYAGVSIMKNRYRSQIKIEGNKYHIGLYSNPEEAAYEYDKIHFEWLGCHSVNNKLLLKATSEKISRSS